MYLNRIYAEPAEKKTFIHMLTLFVFSEAVISDLNIFPIILLDEYK
jgi:hypothetical protein